MAWMLKRRRSIGPIEVPLSVEGGAGAILLWRDDETVTLDLNGITVPPGNYATHLVAVPAGFSFIGKHFFTAQVSGVRSVGSVLGMYSGAWLSWCWMGDGDPARMTDPLSGQYRYRTSDPFPQGVA